MVPPSTEINNLHAHICSAVSDPTRILLLYALAEGPRNVTQLTETLGQPQSTVSRHLATLRGAGLVWAERSGRQVVYALTDDRVIQALELMRSILADRVIKYSDLLSEVEIG